jgi:predicted TIM-barrel fold metal-dependent hydrolase
MTWTNSTRAAFHDQPPRSLSSSDRSGGYLLARWREALKRAGIDHPDGFPFVPRWSADSALALMDEVGIGMALLSISSPGLSFVTGNERSSLARAVNEDGAAAVRDHSDRFGLFASLPLPDVDAALEEIAHASQTLHADGFVLMTNYDGVYLGDRRLEPVMEELNRRGAVVALHPTSPPRSEAVALGRPSPLIEFIFDTTRAVPGLLAIASAERLLYASDTPFTPPNLIQADARALVEMDVLDDSQRHGLFTDNAAQLSPAGWLASGAVPRMALEEPLIRSEYRCRPGARPGPEAESLKVGDDESPRPG